MITTLWQSYADADYEACLRIAADQITKQSGIDSLAAAGASLIHLRRREEGILLLKAATALRPDTPDLYHFACGISGEYILGDELDYFSRQGLRDFPYDIPLQRARAVAQLLRMDYPAAFAFYEAAIRDNPDDFHAHLNMATMHRTLSNFDAAEQHYAAAHRIDPTNVDVAIGRASIDLMLGRSAEARAALADMQDHPHVRFLLATDALARGDYQTGWTLNRDRWDTATGKSQSKPPRPFDALSEIKGARVAVIREGGHGDMIQFMRYIPLLAADAAHVLLYVAPSELRLVQYNVPTNVTLITSMESPDGYQYTTALFDLPYHFRTTVETIPPAPYLTVPADIMSQRRLPPTTLKRVGLCWAGGEQTNSNDRAHDRRRSIDLNQLACLNDLADHIEFINLQAGTRGTDAGLVTTRVLEPEFDWLDTAAIIAQLDLVISVDTAVVHVAGGLGCPTWLLSRSDPCWRWLGNRPDAPWYSGIVRVFGQTAYDDWRPIVAIVRNELEVWANDFAAVPD